MTHVVRGVALALAALAATVTAQQPPAADATADHRSQPRFRGGANLVRVDAYVTRNGQPVNDLTIDDFEVLEDNVPQRLESFEVVQPRPPAPQTAVREPSPAADGRLFVVFMDLWHVQVTGSDRAQVPLTRLLDRTIGQDDLVGVMHPGMAARNMAFGRRKETVAGVLKEHWYWGNKLVTSDPREQEIDQCYPDTRATAGIAQEMIRRRRETRTLNALEELILHLEGVREERKFVFLLTEGWLLEGQAPPLARVLRSEQDSSAGPSCERERSMLAYADHRAQFDLLIQRANRANVSFYPIDFRELVASGEPVSASPALRNRSADAAPSADAARLHTNQEAMRVIAANTDGHAILDRHSFDRDLERVIDDTGAYFLIGYYSTNTRLDGKYRRLTVRVRQPDLEVRTRPGYLAPDEADLASSRVEALMNGAPPGHTTIPRSIAHAFAGLGPIRGTVPLRVQTAAAPARIWIVGELDAGTAKAPQWMDGARVTAVLEHAAGARPPIHAEGTLDAGRRTFIVTAPPGVDLAPGRYVVRVELLAETGAVPLATTTDAFVPEAGWLVSQSGLSARRGPSTGLEYLPTADARYRRTERIRLEVPRASGEGEASARLLGRDGQPLNVPIMLGERTEESSGARLLVVDVTLAPLAQGDYAVEIAVEDGDRKESATYAFRIIP